MTGRKPPPSSSSSPQPPPPKRKPKFRIIDATEAKKLAIVMIITSRLMTWLSSWAMTPSSSDGDSSSMIPVVAHTVACFCERPIANALGIGVWAIATRGFGRSACRQSRSIIAWSSGASAGETSRAPAAASAILSLAKSWNRNNPPATRMMRAALWVAAKSTATKTT